MDNAFKLGADPEALLVIKRTGRIRSPLDVIYDPDPHDRFGRAAAVGRDGDRETSSFELRPGASDSAVVLVDKMAELIGDLHKHYHPRGIAYRAGAYHEPEPLGGHIHLSWAPDKGLIDSNFSGRIWQVSELLRGFVEMSEFLIPKLFNEEQVKNRLLWAKRNARDFASPFSLRPATLDLVMKEAHVEYRYPPSWLDSPEAAYCFLGGAEFIVRTVLSGNVGAAYDWKKFVRQMYSDPNMSPPNSPPLNEALAVAQRFTNQEDFAVNWIG